jgi:hypothetical protein
LVWGEGAVGALGAVGFTFKSIISKSRARSRRVLQEGTCSSSARFESACTPAVREPLESR